MSPSSTWHPAIDTCSTTDQIDIQATLSKRALSKPDSKFGPLPAELHLYLCNWTLSKADTSLNRTVTLVPRVSALERVDSIILTASNLLTSPLDMQQVFVPLECQSVGGEVVLHRWVGLLGVSPLTAHVQVLNVFVVGYAVLLAAQQLERVWTILEGSPELGGVDGELQLWLEEADVNVWVSLNQPKKHKDKNMTVRLQDDMCSTHS